LFKRERERERERERLVLWCNGYIILWYTLACCHAVFSLYPYYEGAWQLIISSWTCVIVSPYLNTCSSEDDCFNCLFFVLSRIIKSYWDVTFASDKGCKVICSWVSAQNLWGGPGVCFVLRLLWHTGSLSRDQGSVLCHICCDTQDLAPVRWNS
jgi:hypothetical protein